jgi:elongation factor G
MAHHAVADIRDIALVGHRAAGKTSLADALLFEAHAVDRLGRVDDGTSAADTDPDEQRHHFSIDAHVLHAEHAGKHLHILDAPGSPDFIAGCLESLAAVETAVVVVSAVDGVQPHARRMFDAAGQLGLGRVVVVNKLDADGLDFPAVVDGIRTAFGRRCVPFNLPVGCGSRFTGVACVLDPPPAAGCGLDPAAVREQLIDAVVEADEALTEKFLSGEGVTPAELEAAIPAALAAGTLIPIFCTSATKDVGVRELLDALSRHGLSPSYARRRLDGLAVRQDDFLGQVFKVVNDRYVGHLSFIRVLAGTLTPHHTVYSVNTGRAVKVGTLLLVQGKAGEPVCEAGPGDIVAVAKVDGLHVGDTVAFRPDAPLLPAIPFPAPMFGLALQPKTRGDEQKLAAGLHKIAEEDPTVAVSHDPQTHELVVSGVSQLHLDVVRERLKNRFDVDVTAKDPTVPYHETVLVPGGADHRHKKQTGGRGQFAEVHLRVHPLDRDITTQQQLEERFANRGRFEKLRGVKYDPAYNFAFLDHTVGGSIPANFLPAVEKGCREVLDRGPLAGFRMQDVAVEVFFGKSHDVDSSEAAFKTAGRIAFRKAILATRPALLEPVVRLEVTVPTRFVGAVLGDLPARRAHVEDQTQLAGDLTAITARAPLAEVARYAAHLGGLTQGQGAYTLELSHYDPVPAALQAQVVAKAGRQVVEDE